MVLNSVNCITACLAEPKFPHTEVRKSLAYLSMGEFGLGS